MKKILIFLFSILLLTGCNTSNEPRTEVEKLFTNYNSLSSDVLLQIDKVMYTEDLTDREKQEYKDIIKKQYEDLKYGIINETIYDDKAIVSVEIEVYNLKQAIDDANNEKENYYVDGKLNKEEFENYKLSKMKEQNERIKYTIDLELNKISNTWYLNDLYESDLKKIHGLY